MTKKFKDVKHDKCLQRNILLSNLGFYDNMTLQRENSSYPENKDMEG